MMETVLNVGLNDYSVKGLAEAAQDERFAWDSYRRLLQMFGGTVLDIPAELFEKELSAAKDRAGVTADVELTSSCCGPGRDVQALLAEHTGRDFPQDPREQLDMAMRAVFNSWNTDRARIYRRRERIPQDLGTAVNVCAMVFGNLGETSGTGVCFTRDPATGKQGVYGDYLTNAQGEDVVAGIRNTLSLEDFARLDPASHGELTRMMRGWRPTTGTCATSSSPSSAASCGCCRPGGKTHGGSGVPHRRPTGRRAADHPGRGAAPGHRHQLSQLMFPQFDPDADRAAGEGHGRLAGRGGRRGRLRLGHGRGAGRRSEGRCSWSAARRSPTTWRA